MRPCPQCGTACETGHHYCPGCGFPIGQIGTSEDKLVGQTLPGGYLVLDLISVGGMGRVYRAEQRALGRTVAVKVIHPHLLSDDNSIVRFMTEARAASQLNHPNSVSVIDFGRTDDGQPYLVMEFLRGKDLARVAYEEGPLPYRRIVEVLKQALAALSESHELGIVHRDMKPENIILEPLRRGGDFVKVVDFGLAKLKADTRR
jgi:serine/threonine-protein kinase